MTFYHCGVAIFSVAILAACQPPDFKSPHGVSIYLNGHRTFLTPESTGEMEDYLIDGFETLGYPKDKILSCLAQATVDVENFPIACPGAGTCFGYQLGAQLHVADTGCPYESAYIHEHAHWQQWCVKHELDYWHHDKAVWDMVRAYPVKCGQPWAWQP